MVVTCVFFVLVRLFCLCWSVCPCLFVSLSVGPVCLSVGTQLSSVCVCVRGEKSVLSGFGWLFCSVVWFVCLLLFRTWGTSSWSLQVVYCLFGWFVRSVVCWSLFGG